MVIAYAAERQFMVMVSFAFYFLAHGTGHERRRDRPRCHGTRRIVPRKCAEAWVIYGKRILVDSGGPTANSGISLSNCTRIYYPNHCPSGLFVDENDGAGVGNIGGDILDPGWLDRCLLLRR